MHFRKYQHLERYGTDEVEGINIGTCYVFPKIDGTNASLWLGDDGQIKAGSRNRELSLENDNQGFFAWASTSENVKQFFSEHPTVTLYGEWLVPHTLKTYREDAWRQFYVFDVVAENGDYWHYSALSLVNRYGLHYTPCIKAITNGAEEDFRNCVKTNTFLIEDGKGLGEGVVIKNYGFRNKYGRVTWAKIVTNEFKEKHTREMGSPNLERKLIEQEIADEFVTKALCEKVYAKIKSESGWSSKKIPQLLNVVFYDLVREDAWNFVKKHKYPTINFKTLQKVTFDKVKEHLSEVF